MNSVEPRAVTVAYRVDTLSRLVVILGVFYGGQDFEAEMAQGDPDRGNH